MVLPGKKIIPTSLCSTKRQRRYFQDESFTALPAGKGGTVLEIKIREFFFVSISQTMSTQLNVRAKKLKFISFEILSMYNSTVLAC